MSWLATPVLMLLNDFNSSTSSGRIFLVPRIPPTNKISLRVRTAQSIGSTQVAKCHIGRGILYMICLMCLVLHEVGIDIALPLLLLILLGTEVPEEIQFYW